MQKVWHKNLTSTFVYWFYTVPWSKDCHLFIYSKFVNMKEPSDIVLLLAVFQEKMKKKIYEEELPKQMEFFDKILQENNQGKGYFVGDKVCVVIS